MRAALVLALVVVASILLASRTLVEPPRDSARETSQIEPLPKIAPA